MRRKLYKKPNKVTTELDWRYSDYKKSNSFYEYNQYNIKTHMSWLDKVLKYTYRNGRKQTQTFIPYTPMELGEYILPKSEKYEVEREDGSKYTMLRDVISKEDKINNEKYRVRYEGNIRRGNLIDKYLDKQKIAIDFYISDYLNWEVRNSYKRDNDMGDNKTLGKWYIERVIYRWRRFKPTYGSSQNSTYKEVIDKQSMSYNCLWDLTNHIFSVCNDWSEDVFEEGLVKYYKPIKEKHNLNSGYDSIKTLSVKLGDDYMKYLNRITNEKERSWEWNDDFEKLFNDTMSK